MQRKNMTASFTVKYMQYTESLVMCISKQNCGCEKKVQKCKKCLKKCIRLLSIFCIISSVCIAPSNRCTIDSKFEGSKF